MEWIVFGVILGPIALLFFLFFLPRGRGRQLFIVSSTGLYFLSAIVLFFYPVNAAVYPIPPIIWKFSLLLTIAIVFAHSIRNKRYIITVLTSIQLLLLVLMEILKSPAEPVPFVQFGYDGKVLFLAGSFVIAFLVPLILKYLNKYFKQVKASESWIRQPEIGIFLLMAALAGLITANSITGLFLFWQWAYLANMFLFQPFQHPENRKRQIHPYIQQAALTIWMAMIPLIYPQKGSLLIADLCSQTGEFAGAVAVLIFIVVVIMGWFFPDKYLWKSYFSRPTPVTGLIMVMLSLVAPMAILLKFRALYSQPGNALTYMIVIYGSFLMAAAAFHAGTYRKAGQILSGMVISVAGWGLATVFTGMESMFFSTGYIAVTSITLALLFGCVTVLEYVTGTQDVEQMHHLFEEMPFTTAFMSVALTLFLFAPFYSALQRLVFLHFMDGNPLSVILVAAGISLMSVIIFRWLSVLVAVGEKNMERKSTPFQFKIILTIAFSVTIATNLLFGNIYEYFLQQPIPIGVLPARDIENYVGLHGILYLFKPGIGLICLGGSILLLSAMFFLTRKLQRGREKLKGTGTHVFYHYSIAAWLPKHVYFDKWIRTGWIMVLMLLVGVVLHA